MTWSLIHRRCLAFEMQVLAHDSLVRAEIIAQMGAEPVTLDELLTRDDRIHLRNP
jgi:hypothetical protein